MAIRFNTVNHGNVTTSRPKVTLRPPEFLKEKPSFSITDSYKGSMISKGSPGEKKDSPIRLMNPLLLFSVNSAHASSVNKSQTQNTNQLSIQWEKQFNDPAVVKGSAPAGYTSIGNVTGIPMSKVIEAAKIILAKKQPLGTCTPLRIDGFNLLAVDQTHFWTIRNGEKVNVPDGLHGVTVYIKSPK